jgi:hypothetical protein
MSPLPRAGLSWCNQCGKPIRWSITAAGMRQALNPEEDPEGNTVAYRDAVGTWRSRVPTAELPKAPHEKWFMPHAATCLQAPRNVAPHRLPEGVASLAAHRRAKKGPRR